MALISSIWFVLLVGLLHEVLGQTTGVNTSAEADTGFIGWYIGPSTSETLLELFSSTMRVRLILYSRVTHRSSDLDDIRDLRCWLFGW